MKRIEGSPTVLQARSAAQYIASRTPLRPRLGLILGSGWSSVAQGIDQEADLDYNDIPHFPQPHVQGHPGRLLAGILSGRPVMAFCGRPHLYEGYTMAQAAFPVLVLRELGATHLLLTNAAGGLNPSLESGDLMMVTDHISLPGLAGASPLAGLEGAFLDMRRAYDPELRDVARTVAASLGERLPEGVYAMVGGPTYETKAEALMLRAWGADAVGMSTVPEVIAARWAGMRVLALSLITNAVLPPATSLTHQDVLRRMEQEAPRLRRFVGKLIEAWPR